MTNNVSIAINCFRTGGGMERYTFDIVRAFAAQGRDTKVYAAQIDKSCPEAAMVELYHINQKIIPKKLRPYFFTKQLEKVLRADEKLIACNPSDHAAIFICGGTHLGYLHNTGRRPTPLDHLTIHRNRTNYATAKSIMAHSELMRQELMGFYGIPSDKIRVVYPPADTKRFRPSEHPEETAALRKKYGFRDNETVFLFPSTGHTRKGLDLLQTFFSQTDLPVKLAVAGSPLPRPIRNMVELGFCKNMPELYRAADYTVMASLYEPFGLVGVESVLCGTRVVLSKNMACTEVMNSSAGFFFDRDTPETLADAVSKAVSLKQRGNHKIPNPSVSLTYNPTVEQHMTVLQEMLDAV